MIPINPRNPVPTSRVLVVDDDADMIRLIREVLDLMPSEVLVRTNGEQALALLHEEMGKEHSIDAVLLDVMMPGQDGFHILSRMKSDPVLEQIPVILITGLNSIAAKTRGLQMGADDYITKPFDPQELLARISVVMRIRRSERMLRQRNQELAALDNINRVISSSLNLDEVLVSALNGLEQMIDADAFAVVLNSEDSQDWMVRAARMKDPAAGIWLEGRVVPLNDPTLREATNEILTVMHSDISKGFWNDVLKAARLDILCVPLVKNREAIGALVVLQHQGNLSTQHNTLIEHVAATVVVAVDKARLYHDLEVFAEEVERSQAQLVQAEKMAAVGRLAASLAHEINNPLQAIQNSLHLALHQGLEEDRRRQFVDMAQNEVNRLVQIVRRMLDFYRPSSITQKLDVNRPVQDALIIAGKRLQQSKIDVEPRLSPKLPNVRGTSNQLTQVFLNIIINAIDAMPDGGKLWVGTVHNKEDREIVIAFRDNGPGIPIEIRNHLFEPFYTTKNTGTGLGLAISYGIIEKHQGVIEVDSSPGNGTTFIVRLPECPEGDA